MKICRYLSILLLLIIYGCNKNEDSTPPTITILSPNANSMHQVLNNIEVEVLVKDDTNLDYVSFDVIDSQGGIAVNQVNKSNLTKEENIEIQLEITDIHLESGQYYLRIVASDGTNKKSEFVAIYIQTVPLQLKKTVLFNHQTFTLDSLDSQGNTPLIYQFNRLPELLTINSYYQEGVIAFNNPSEFYIIDMENPNYPTSINLPYNQIPNFHNNIHIDPLTHHYYITTNSGHVVEMGPDGSLLLTFQISTNLKPNLVTTLDNLIFIEEKNANFTPNSLKAYYKNYGAIASSHYLNFNLTFMAPLNTNELLLVGNSDQNGIIAKYLIQENTIINLVDNIPTTLAACQLNENEIAIHFNDQIQSYSINNNGATLLNTWSIIANDITYNKVSNTLIGVSDNEYFSINMSTSTISSLPLSNYSEVELLFNK